MTDQLIDILKSIAESATSGKWSEVREGNKHCIVGERGEIICEVYYHPDPYKADPNGAFIATFDPPTVLKLLDAAKERAYIEDANRLVDDLHYAENKSLKRQLAKANSLLDECDELIELAELDEDFINNPFSRMLEKLRAARKHYENT